MDGHRWKDKLAFVGMEWEILRSEPDDSLHPVLYLNSAEDILNKSACFAVKVRYPQGRSSFGYGSTLEYALGDGARSLGIDWYSVEREMTEVAWASIAHC